MSLFPILCSCLVHHNPAVVVVYVISSDQKAGTVLDYILFLFFMHRTIILQKIFLPKVQSLSWSSCINVLVLLLYSKTYLVRALCVLTLYYLKYTVHNYYVLLIHFLLPISFNMYVVFPSFPFKPVAPSVVFDAITIFFLSSDFPFMSIIWLHLLVRIKIITLKLTLPLFRMWTYAVTCCADCIRLLVGRGMNICHEVWSLNTVMQPHTVYNQHKEFL